MTIESVVEGAPHNDPPRVCTVWWDRESESSGTGTTWGSSSHRDCFAPAILRVSGGVPSPLNAVGPTTVRLRRQDDLDALNAFPPGSLAQLRGGGPVLTVESIRNGEPHNDPPQVCTIWWDRQGEPSGQGLPGNSSHRECFLPAALKAVPGGEAQPGRTN